MRIEHPDQFRAAVDLARRDEVLLQGVRELYGELERRIAERRPVCVVSGRCCRFDEFGHRLYLTALEMALFLTDAPDALKRLRGPAEVDPSGCPFQINRLCSVHIARPFGCRVFFCDATATDWQQAQYEELHARIRDMHDRREIPYFYVEWREGLRAVSEVDPRGADCL